MRHQNAGQVFPMSLPIIHRQPVKLGYVRLGYVRLGYVNKLG
jgi:hypothetical protein